MLTAAAFPLAAAAGLLWLRLRAERRLTARLLAARIQALDALVMVPRGPCRCGDWLAGCPVHTRDFWAARISEESAS